MYQEKIRLSVLVIFFLSCTHKASFEKKYVPWYVANYKLSNSGVTEQSVTQNVYKTTLSRTLGTSCTHLPSCSAHTSVKMKKCGFFWGMSSGLGRFFSEPDRPFISRETSFKDEKFYFIDNDTSCSIW